MTERKKIEAAVTLRMLWGADGKTEIKASKTKQADLRCKACELPEAFRSYRAENGKDPSSVEIEDLGTFTPAILDFGGRLSGKIAIVTGGGKGIGAGIAEALAKEGARVSVVDIDGETAEKTAKRINRVCGRGHAISLYADVTKEEDVANAVAKTVNRFGGLDIYVNNAGIVRAGGVADFSLADFERVTAVNYTAYFLGVKYAVIPMRAAKRACASYTADIVEINSKSGLEGSNRNFAYAGSKAGGIGLTESFALELASDGIKVNAVCPGNYLDGELWSDPDHGLFVSYLKAGKVPGAKTVSDVRKYYESKVPMGRGCTLDDITRAVLYAIEQPYETGQAIPVTGGQVMLK